MSDQDQKPFAVRCGNLFQCVMAESAFQACLAAVRRHKIDPMALPLRAGNHFEVMGVGFEISQAEVIDVNRVREAMRCSS